MKRYGFTVIACVIVAVLAMAMTSAAAEVPTPRPIQLFESPPDPQRAAATRWGAREGERQRAATVRLAVRRR